MILSVHYDICMNHDCFFVSGVFSASALQSISDGQLQLRPRGGNGGISRSWSCGSCAGNLTCTYSMWSSQFLI